MSQREQIHNNDKLVTTGQMCTGSKNGLISTTPLGSCVAVIAYDKGVKAGGIAHVMLPGKSQKGNNSEENKYARNAVENLLFELNYMGASETEICLVGGANVLKRENDTIADSLVFCILEVVKQKKINIKETSLGGYERRTAKLNLETGAVTYTIGDKKEEELFNFIADNTRRTIHV